MATAVSSSTSSSSSSVVAEDGKDEDVIARGPSSTAAGTRVVVNVHPNAIYITHNIWSGTTINQSIHRIVLHRYAFH